LRLICGIVRLDGAQVERAMLANMGSAMVATDQPSTIGISVAGRAGLAVLSLGARAAELTGSDGSQILAADLRLDAPLSLAQTLGLPAGTAADALLLGALKRWADSPKHVLGDFAFGLWDVSAQRLLLGRDAFGVRPLYYSWVPGRFLAFASLPAGLHRSGLVERRLDEAAILRDAAKKTLPGTTVLMGIQSVPPAHVLTLAGSTPRLTRYWSAGEVAAGQCRDSYQEAVLTMRRLLEQAVHCRLPANGPVVAQLSGGLDSSSIAVIAARKMHQAGGSVYAHSFLDRQRNDVALEDESAQVRAVLEAEPALIGTSFRAHHLARLSKEVLAEDHYASDDAENPEIASVQAAAEQGAGIILSGWGGDEAVSFNGRGVLAEHLLRGRWRTLVREIAALRTQRQFSVSQILASHIGTAITPAPLLSLAERLGGRHALRVNLNSVLTSKGRRTMRQGRAPSLRPDGRATSAELLSGSHIAHNCETLAHIGARHGIAFAFPLLDRRLVEYALSLPSAYFLRGGFRRAIFRDAVKGLLPEPVRLRHIKSVSFPSLPLALAEQKADVLAALQVLESSGSVENWLDIARLRERVESLPDPEVLKASMSGNYAGSANDILVFRMLRLAAFLGGGREDANPAAPASPRGSET
jgi:asparagine synthase (glutamine-hydrolysing)